MQAHRYILSSIFDLKDHITSLKNIRGSITLKPFNIVKGIYILFSSKTQSVIYTVEQSLGVIQFLFTASKGIIFFLKTSYVDLKHVYKMASILKEDLTSHHANVKKIVEDNENSRGQKYTL